MNLLPPAARGIEAPALTLGAAKRSGDWQWPHVATGLGMGFAYLVAAGAQAGSLMTAAGAAALAIALVWPVAGLTMLALILPMREPEVFKPIYIDAALVGATAFGCLARLPGDRLPLRIHPGLILAVGYGAYSALSVLPQISGHPPEWTSSAANELVRLLAGMGLFVVASYLFRHTSPGPIIAVALVGASMAALLATTTYLGAQPLGSLTDGLLAPLRGERASGGFSNANYLGFYTAQALLLALGSWSFARPVVRPALALIVVVLIVTVALSFSRSAYLASVVGAILLTSLRSRRVAVLLAIAGIAAAAIAYPLFLEARLGAEVLDPGATAARLQSENWRRIAAAAGFAMFSTEPIFGIGFGVFHFVSPAFIGASPATYSHNQFVNILAEQGLVGAVMVAGIVAFLAFRLVASTHPLRGTAIVMLIAYLVQSTFINSTTSFQISGLTWLTMAAAVSGPLRRSLRSNKEY